VITNASDPAIWVSKDLPDQGFFAFESVPYVNRTHLLPPRILTRVVVASESFFSLLILMCPTCSSLASISDFHPQTGVGIHVRSMGSPRRRRRLNRKGACSSMLSTRLSRLPHRYSAYRYVRYVERRGLPPPLNECPVFAYYLAIYTVYAQFCSNDLTNLVDVDTPDGRAATKVGPFSIESEDGKGAPTWCVYIADVTCHDLHNNRVFCSVPFSHKDT